MTRWHDSSCTTPDIFLAAEQVPSCRTCGRICPSVEMLITERHGGAVSVSLPEDQPPDQMNLWWPRSVPYVQTGIQTQSLDACILLPSRPRSNLKYPPPYETALKQDSFRLACLSSVPNQDFPLHLSLETFADNDHPEYECTSYAWGGENGDNTLCRPVYIGEYWDVLLQTQNCWSMLRFLRPWRGIRMVWVDAVCINQDDMEERGAQVGKMRKIYGDCSRVILYLGEDVITRPTRFPALRHLDTLERPLSSTSLFPVGHRLHGAHYGLRDILSRRYFSRVWVIQELIVSPRVLIRVGDVDMSADAHIIGQMEQAGLEDVEYGRDSHLSAIAIRQNDHPSSILPKSAYINKLNKSTHYMPHGDLLWSTTDAPWFRNLAKKVIPRTEVNSVFGLLRLTATSSVLKYES